LVEIPFEEFRLSYPKEDVDVTLRRYERIDSSRRKILESVLAEWRNLCESGWQPSRSLPADSGEAIIEVQNPSAYCKVLEIQANKFRRIEQQQWKVLQKMLFKEISAAAEQMRNKSVLQRQEIIFEKQAKGQSERERNRNLIRREELKVRRQNELKKVEEIKISQTRAAEDQAMKEAEEEEKRKALKQRRAQREAERARRAEFARQLKNALIAKMEARMEQQLKQHEMREKESAERMEALRERREKLNAEKRGAVEERLDRAKTELEKREARRKQEVNGGGVVGHCQ